MKKILRVQPIYTMIIWGVLFGLMMIMVFLEKIMNWEKSEIGITLIYYCFMGMCATVALIIFLYYLQFALVDENGIVIRGLFYKITEMRWMDIKEISIERVCTYDNRSQVYLRGIILKLNNNECIKGRAGRNRKGKSPWYIIASKKNLAIIKNYYPSLNDKTITSFESNQ